MKKQNDRRSLFIHRRDLRLDDNTALIEAGKNSDHVLSCFIVDPRQVKNNPYRSESAVRFMYESLVDLDEQYRARGSALHLFRGIAHEVIATVIVEQSIDSVYINRDYTPFSVERDKSIEEACKNLGVTLYAFDDALLHAPATVMKADGSPYTVFTPYFRKARQEPLREPTNFSETLPATERGGPAGDKDLLSDWLELGDERAETVPGGRSRALEILDTMDRHQSYQVDRDIPERDGTTRLSAYLKFGCCSAREAARAIRSAFGDDSELLRQLYWRDFFTQVAWFHPRVFEGPFNERYASIEWENDQAKFDAWREGRTGFPIVDAGMRELEQTGYMHNRARMIVASFLTKDLHIDWRWGERHFASRLVDYDPAVNNGSWQWAASTGCDAQPYFRIFNPWLQQKRFDADAVYVKRWVEELEPLTPAEIHNLWKTRPDGIDYAEPVVDHAIRSKEAKEMYQAARGSGPPNDR